MVINLLNYVQNALLVAKQAEVRQIEPVELLRHGQNTHAIDQKFRLGKVVAHF